MTATPGENSYVTVAEATTYFESRYGYIDGWDGQTEAQKDAALVSAFSLLDMACAWFGSKTDADQVAEFPRMGQETVPELIKAAQCEIAYSFVKAGSANVDQDDVVTGVTAGDVSLTFKGVGGKTGGPYSDYVKMILGKYGLCNFGRSLQSVDLLRS